MVRLRHLNLDSCGNIHDDTVLHVLPRLKQLEDLRLSRCQACHPCFCDHSGPMLCMLMCCTVCCLCADQCKHLDNCWQHLVPANHVFDEAGQWLQCASMHHHGQSGADLGSRGGAQITDAGLAGLQRCSRLQRLDLAGCEGLSNACMPHIIGLKHLLRLSMEHCRLSDPGMPVHTAAAKLTIECQCRSIAPAFTCA